MRFTARCHRVRRRQSSGSFVSPRRPRRRPPSPVTRASSQKSKIFDIFPSHRAIAPRHPPRTRSDRRTRFLRAVITARAPPSFASRATPRVKITRRRGRITIARPSHRASVRPDPAPRRASARAPARRNISRARASRSRALASLAHLLCVVQTTRRKVKCARRPDVSRIFAIDVARAGVEPHRVVRARSSTDAARFDDGDRRSIDRAASRSRDVGGAIEGESGKNL